jgi:hypothetical protein
VRSGGKLVVARDGHARVKVEAVDLDGTLVARWRLAAAAALVRSVWRIAQGAHGSALHRDHGAGVERSLRAGLLRVVFARGRVQQLAPCKPCEGAPMHASDDLAQLFTRGRRRRMKARVTLLVAREDAVEHHRMEVHVEVDR